MPNEPQSHNFARFDSASNEKKNIIITSQVNVADDWHPAETKHFDAIRLPLSKIWSTLTESNSFIVGTFVYVFIYITRSHKSHDSVVSHGCRWKCNPVDCRNSGHESSGMPRSCTSCSQMLSDRNSIPRYQWHKRPPNVAVVFCKYLTSK